MAGAEHFLRHAIGAAKIATIRHRDAKIPERTLELIAGTGHGKRRGEAPGTTAQASRFKPLQAAGYFRAASHSFGPDGDGPYNLDRKKLDYFPHPEEPISAVISLTKD
jgi:hypothetical protein